jgi:hypothetical protein
MALPISASSRSASVRERYLASRSNRAITNSMITSAFAGSYLVNLVADRAGATGLSAEHTEKAKALPALWEKWNGGNVPPRWADRRWDGEEARRKKDKGR